MPFIKLAQIINPLFYHFESVNKFLEGVSIRNDRVANSVGPAQPNSRSWQYWFMTNS